MLSMAENPKALGKGAQSKERPQGQGEGNQTSPLRILVLQPGLA